MQNYLGKEFDWGIVFFRLAHGYVYGGIVLVVNHVGDPPFCELDLELFKREGRKLSTCRVSRGSPSVSLSTLDCDETL